MNSALGMYIEISPTTLIEELFESYDESESEERDAVALDFVVGMVEEHGLIEFHEDVIVALVKSLNQIEPERAIELLNGIEL